MIRYTPYGTPTTKVLENHKPIVAFTHYALEKIDAIVRNSALEVGWLCSIVKDKNVYAITDVLLFKQEVHETTTEINPDSMNEMFENILAQENGVELYNSIKGWGHSHVNMSVTPSSQDNDQMKYFEEAGNDFFVRLIANKKGEMKVDLYDYQRGVVYENVDWQEYVPVTNGLEEEIKAELQEKVKRKTYATTYTTGTYGSYPKYVNDKKKLTTITKEAQKEIKKGLKNAKIWKDLISLGFEYADAYLIKNALTVQAKYNVIQGILDDIGYDEIVDVLTLNNIIKIAEAYCTYVASDYYDREGGWSW